jgi:hypothetical protein
MTNVQFAVAATCVVAVLAFAFGFAVGRKRGRKDHIRFEQAVERALERQANINRLKSRLMFWRQG